MNKIVCHLERKRCPKCKKVISARPPGILANRLYENQLLTYVTVQHYFYCNTLGHIEKQTGIGSYTLHDMRRTCLEGYAGLHKSAQKNIIGLERFSLVLGLSWRVDGLFFLLACH